MTACRARWAGRFVGAAAIAAVASVDVGGAPAPSSPEGAGPEAGTSATAEPTPESREKERVPVRTSSGWQVRCLAGRASSPNPEKSSGTPFEDDGALFRYARIATVSFDPPSAGAWSTRARSSIKVDAIVVLESFNRGANEWEALPGKPLFTSSYSRRVEAGIDDDGAVHIEYDDGSSSSDPDDHLRATIVPGPTGKGAVIMSGPHGGKAPYNLPPDSMNALCVFQKRKGTSGERIEVATDPETSGDGQAEREEARRPRPAGDF